jgi:hypothetical protein
LKKQVDTLANIHQRGAFVDTEDFHVERLPDGRMRLHLQPGRLGAGATPTVPITPTPPAITSNFGFQGPTGFASSIDTVSLETQYTVDLRLELVGGNFNVFGRVNGVEASAFTETAFSVDQLRVGAYASNAIVNNQTIDDLLVGTTGYGSSDLFSYDFSAAIVPPFDSQTGTGLSIAGGALVVNNAGTDAYAVKNLSVGIGTIYAQAKITVHDQHSVGAFLSFSDSTLASNVQAFWQNVP